MQKAESVGLKNVEKMETSGEPEIKLTDESVDVVLLFDVLHSFYFPHAGDRKKLLGEIYRIMKRSAILSISVWPNLMEPETEDEIKNADFRLEKEVFETLTDGNKDLEVRKILNFKKTRYVPTIAVAHESGRRQHEQSNRSHR